MLTKTTSPLSSISTEASSVSVVTAPDPLSVSSTSSALREDVCQSFVDVTSAIESGSSNKDLAAMFKKARDFYQGLHNQVNALPWDILH